MKMKLNFKTFVSDIVKHWNNSELYDLRISHNHIEFLFGDYMCLLFFYYEETGEYKICFNNIDDMASNSCEDVYSGLELEDIKNAYELYNKIVNFFEGNSYYIEGVECVLQSEN